MATVHTVTTGNDVTVTTQHLRALRALLITVHNDKDLGAEHVKAIVVQLVSIEATLALKEADDAKKAATEAAQNEDYLDWLTEQARNDPRY